MLDDHLLQEEEGALVPNLLTHLNVVVVVMVVVMSRKKRH
jgi:hypothetical protein